MSNDDLFATQQANETQLDDISLAQVVPADDGDEDTLPFGDSLHGLLSIRSKPVCLRCGYEVDPFRAQLKSKGAAKETYICNGCNAKATMLSRTTNWPLPEFLELSQEEQQKFWRECHAQNGAPAVKALLTNTIVKSKSTSIEASLGGDYLPLSVWKAKGYDADEIEAKCADTMQHPLLGKVYRVQILGISRTAKHEEVRKNICDLIERKKPKLTNKPEALPLADGQDDDQVPPEAERAECDDASDDKDKPDESEHSSSSKSSSSSSSDSSSRHKKKKKSKKSKKTAKKSKRGKAKRQSKGRKGSQGSKDNKASKGDDDAVTKKRLQ